MGKRAVGIPSVDLAKRSRGQRATQLGIGSGSSIGRSLMPYRSGAGVTEGSPAASVGSVVQPLPSAQSSSSGLALHVAQVGACTGSPTDGADTTPGAALRQENPHRSDAPILRTGRTMAPRHRRPSDNITNMDEAISNYHRDKFASSSLASRASMEKTWLEYHEKAMKARPAELRCPPFPLTPMSLAGIGALMKLDDFRAFANYLAWAKGQHIRLGHDWTQQLDLEAREAGRSVNRGLGPARQSADFSLSDVAAHVLSTPVRTPQQPAFPHHMALLCALWVLREIEGAWACKGDITVNREKLTIAWHLPVSKTDPFAKAVTRSWGCLCEPFGIRLCPYHLMTGYLDLLFIKYGDFANFGDGFPLFPDIEGKVVAKRGVVRGLETVLEALGCQVLDPSGRKRFGGHSFRVAGSRFWTLRGLEVFKLQIFARWGSNAILRYVADIPLVNITGEVSGSSANAGQAIKSLTELLDKHVQDAQDQVKVLRQEISAIRGKLHPGYVKNNRSGVWHNVLHGGLGTPPLAWRALCGWPFGLQSHELSPDTPGMSCRRCDKCSRLATSVTGSSSSGSSSDGS